MTNDGRRRLRAALKIHASLRKSAGPPAAPMPPLDAWRDLARSARLAAVAAERGWAVAGSAARAAYRRTAAELSDRLAADLRVLDAGDRPGEVQSPRVILADLAALEAEFGEVEVDLREKSVSVTTDPVVLEGVDLGRFELALRWDLEPDSGAYSVIALDPNPAAEDETTTHPHVREEALCEGDGRHAIRRALEEGRLLDFFLLVRSILTTYNPGSAYIPLSRWRGVPCADCGSSVSDDESDRCARCGEDLCLDCSTPCGDCDRSCCADCRERCPGCDESFCSPCLRHCEGCGGARCGGCLTADSCGDCAASGGPAAGDGEPSSREPFHGATDDPDDTEAGRRDGGEARPADAPPAAAASETDAADPAVHAVRLGEAAVPA